MFSYTFQHIGQVSEIDFSKNVIWVLHADKIPPHIGFSANNTFFSLKVSGKDENLNVQNVLGLIHRKKIPTLFIELNSAVSLQNIINRYSEYERATDVSTCLTPIKILLDEPQSVQLSDLLNRIENRIRRIAGIYLPENYTALPSYSTDEIHSYIKQLSNYVER